MSLTKRIGIIIITIFELIFLWVPQELDALYNTRLGFMRQILFMNENYPVKLALYFAIILLVVSVLMIIWWGIRINKAPSKKTLRYLWLFFLAVFLLIYMCVPKNIGDPLYYYDVASLGVAVLLQLIVILMLRKKAKGK